MRAASIHEIKTELSELPPKKLLEICLRLGKFKKENKELLTYILFESGDESGYVESVKTEINEEFKDLPKPSNYHTKKSLRKILRIIGKFSRYSPVTQSEIEMRIYFLSKMRESKIPVRSAAALISIQDQQIKKIKTLISSLHEDLQYDFQKQLEMVSSPD